MDAGADRDLKLQKASGTLIEEFRTRLPLLLYKNSHKHDDSQNDVAPRRVHRWCPSAKAERLALSVCCNCCSRYLEAWLYLLTLLYSLSRFKNGPNFWIPISRNC